MSRPSRPRRVRRLGLAAFAGVLTLAGTADVTSAAPAPERPLPATVIGLRQGAQGPDVASVQEALLRAGVSVRGGADGVFGPMTEAAVSEFQRAKGLAVTGEVDESTASALGLGSSPTPAAASNTGSNGYVGLAVGANGPLVEELQQKLSVAGVFVPGGADGVFGPATKGAVENFQRWNGLEVTGTVTQATATKLGLGTSTPAPAPAPQPAADNPYIGLKIGAMGDRVKTLQNALIAAGITVRGGADGAFGPVTQAALTQYQQANGLTASGAVDAATATKLGLGTSTPAPAPSGAANGNVGYPIFGERSERVRVMQQALLDAGIRVPGGADGVFGAATAGAIMDFQREHGIRVTGKIDDQTAGTLGIVPGQAPSTDVDMIVPMQVFPVQGRCWFGDTWHAPRSGGRLHIGTDIGAAEGNLLYAVVDGRISKMYWDSPGSISGNGLRVEQSDGTYFTYLHLSGFAPGIQVGTEVSAGQVIGYMGSTGAYVPHLHFEIHPKGGAAINPYRSLKAIDACHVTAPLPQP